MMKKQWFKISLVACAGMALLGSTQAAIITDGSFDAFSPDTGFFVDPTPSTPTVGTWFWDGLEAAPKTATAHESHSYGSGQFAVARSLDRGAIYQTTGATIALGTTYTLTADVFNTFNQNRSNAALVGRLYYLDGTDRTLIAGAVASYSGSADTEYSSPSTMTFDYIGSSLAVGNALGVEFSWEGGTANPSWIGVDNVSIVPEPSSFALLAGLAGLSCVMVRRRR